ncbi:MAG: helix-turn-helix transcriptional regulator [Bacillota bacterium]
MSLVERIQHLCSSKNTTLIGLEREIGLGRGTIRNWDRNSPSADKIQKVADYFGVSTDYLLYGFERHSLNQLVQYVKNNRTYEQFAEDTGVDLNELMKIGLGFIVEPPSLATIERIAANNPVDFLVSRTDLLHAAGYIDQATASKVNLEENKKYFEAKELNRANLKEDEILTLAAHQVGHEGELTESDLDKIKLAVKIALAKDNK